LLDPWYLENLVCPISKEPLRLEGNFLVSSASKRYPVVDGMPVMLLDDVQQTIGVARATLNVAQAVAEGGSDGGAPLYLETLGFKAEDRKKAEQIASKGGSYDPVVATMQRSTSGNAYAHLVGQELQSYPIPEIDFDYGPPGTLLDVGCNWGRWSMAAAKKGHSVVGVDPQLGAALAARRVAKQLNLNARFVVGDARFLPFRQHSFDYVWSYSVLQHFSRQDVRTTLRQINYVAKPGGSCVVQMANAVGVRNFYQMAKRRFRAPTAFNVRYWTPWELESVFTKEVGATKLTIDCFLGLGLRASDVRHMKLSGKLASLVSESLRGVGKVVPGMQLVADSVYCVSRVGAA
jgi:ubiquinone/menaquinone biosynthesis C-methylase UbiE/uncharacterized protein YbaR (Trm112 family)